MPLIISLVILVVGGPVMAFPELVPELWRHAVTVLITVSAVCSAAWTLRPVAHLRTPVALFAGALLINVVLQTGAPMVSLRHASGVALGLLTMSTLAVAVNSESRLQLVSVIVGVSGLAVVLAGVLSTYFGWDGQKLVLGSTSEQQKLLYPWLPQTQLALPGLEREGGWINANALGGTALMILPFCAGLAAAATRVARWQRRALGLAVGGLGATLCLCAIWMSRSRTSILATVILAVMVAAHWRSARKILAVGVLVTIVLFGLSLNQRRQAAPGLFQAGLNTTVANLWTRASYWRLAATTIAANPMTGIGISQFHEGPPDASGERPYMAHAHNMFLQVGLDVGLLGLVGYLWLFGWVALRARPPRTTVTGLISAGAALSLVAVHLFGLTDAIALGAKVGLFQWVCAGILIADWSRSCPPTQSRNA